MVPQINIPTLFASIYPILPHLHHLPLSLSKNSLSKKKKKMMSGSGSGRSSSRFPFTASQWQELEHQALVFKYMVSGMPIPPDLLFTIRRSLDSSLSSSFLLRQPPHHLGWNSFHMGFGRKIDPEPGRCRRTDGKKWRCSKEAYPDSKYCERHMHRGRNRSRKPVEILSPSSSAAAAAAASPPPHGSRNPPPSYLSSSSSAFASPSESSHFLYPHFHPSKSSSAAPAAAAYPSSATSQESTNFFLKDCRSSSHGMKLGESDEHPFFSSDSSAYPSSKLDPLTMEMKHNPSYHPDLQKLQNYEDDGYRQYYSSLEREEQPKKVMHHFLDEWAPKESESWRNEEKMPTHRTQLSISVPNSLHDFFITQKW